MPLRRLAATLALSCSVLNLTSCLARRRVITRNKGATAQTLLSAGDAALLQLVRTEYALIQALNLTVDMVPALGSVNKGKITEYKDVRAYILFKKPADIRIIGLYPVVRNTAFDMVSNGTDFRLFVPAKNRFVVGRNEMALPPSPNKLENLRPSVFLDALFIQPPGDQETPILEDFTDEDNAIYILHILHAAPDGKIHLARNIWFSRLTLNIVRQVIFDANGEILTDARYSDWKKYGGVPFPRVIDINRPQDEYGVVITVVKAEINKSITDDKFTLEQPEGTTLQVLGNKPGEPDSPAGASRKNPAK